MSKSILLSIKPEWVAKILNGEKTIEVRKKFPKDFVGWVYIYCSKNKTGKNNGNHIGRCYPIETALKTISGKGKVVARFWCDKVETISLPYTYFRTNKWVGCENERTLQTKTLDEPDLLKKSCISEQEIYKYLNFKKSPRECGYAIHISKLEIFDKPKKLIDLVKSYRGEGDYMVATVVSKAPQNYCYIVGEW